MADCVIIGNGPAGRKAAETLRALSRERSIVVVTDEPYPYYPRPRLSLGYISGEVEKEKLFIGPEFYAKNAVSLVFGEVIGLRPDEKRVLLSDGGEVPYQALLIATGALPAPPVWNGSQLDGVVTLRTLVDADDILARAAEETRAVVVGGGILGVEVSEALRKLGKEVVLLIRGGKEKVGAPILKADAAEKRYEKMVAEGIEIRLGDQVGCFEGEGKLKSVRTEQGVCVETGLVVVTIGTRPNVGFLEGSGIRVGKGVVVDAELSCPGAPGVFAAGDVAELTEDGGKHRHGAPWMTATKQGEYAAQRIAEYLAAGQPGRD